MKSSLFLRIALTAGALFLFLSPDGSAQGKLSVGLEWGLSFNPLYYHAETYRASAGYQIDDSGVASGAQLNGLAALSLEWDWMKKHTLGLNLGIRGVGDGHGSLVLPLMLRDTYYFKADSLGTPFLFVEGGALYNMDVSYHFGGLGGIGAGYRHRLGSHMMLDYGARLSGLYYRPDVFDPDTDERVLSILVEKNQRIDLNIELVLALRFR